MTPSKMFLDHPAKIRRCCIVMHEIPILETAVVAWLFKESIKTNLSDFAK